MFDEWLFLQIRTLQIRMMSFASGFFIGWQACRLWRRFLNWWKGRLQEQLQETQRRLDIY
uniref:Mitoregulin n=1 Tax=Monodelphis domestica TaxID=13616 RepID=A0A5F8H9X5_MONDO